MNIILIGMMGCGKSTCGQLLAQKLGRRFVDTDTLIEQREGRSIPDIFAQEGEDYFRDVESAVVRELSQQSNLVIATGGGIVLRAENVAALRKNGYVVWLNRSPEDIYTKVSMSKRPLGQGGKEAFLERFAQREPLYRAAAHLEIPSQDTPRATVELIHRHWLDLVPTRLED